MPVFSYLAYPEPGSKKKLFEALKSLEYCEPTLADNGEILILVTDTPDELQERNLQEKLKKITSLQYLGMTFGHENK